MHNLLYRWLFFVCFLCLPMGSEANIASKRTPLTNPAVVEQQSSGQTVSVFERLKILKNLKNTLAKRLYTEGGKPLQKAKKSTLAQRIFKALLLIVVGILLIYWLQGTIGLALVTGGSLAYWLNRDRIAEAQRRQKERLYAYDQEGKKSYKYKGDNSLSSPANKWTRRALSRFLIGLGLTFLSIIFFIVALISSVSETIAILAVGLFLVGYGFTISSFINAVRALIEKEPQSAWAWLVVLLALPFLFTLLLSIIFGFG
jgi:hypothetical protein